MFTNENLLKLIQDNAELKNDELAAMLGSSEQEIENRIEELKDSHVIKGYKTLINWDKANVPNATALIEVRVTPQKDTGFDDTAKRIMEFPEVKSVYLMSGGYDLAVTVEAPTMSEVAMFVGKRLSTIGGILSTATHFILTKYKEQGTILQSDLEEIDERESILCD